MRMHTSNRMPRLLWFVVIILVLIAVAVVIRRALILVPSLLNGDTPPAPPSNPVAMQFAALDDVFARYQILTLIHIVPALLFVLLGPLQFSATIRARHLRWHRRSGRVYLICGLVVGVSAFVMSFAMPAIGGVIQASATALFSILFLFSMGKAYFHILRGEVARHREWMIRGFAIGLAVALIRPIIGLFFATSRFSGLTPNEFFGIAFWIGFVLSLITAEIWIQWTRPQVGAQVVGKE